MNVITEIIAYPEPTELMKPTNRSFHDPTKYSQPTSVGCSAFGQLGIDAPLPQLLPLFLVVIAPVTQDFVRPRARVPWLTADGGHGLHQGHGLVGVGGVRGQDVDDQRNPLAIGQDFVFTAQFAPIHGARAGFFTSTDGTDMGTVYDKPLEVEVVGMAQVRQENLVDLVPEARRLPIAQAVPAGHATAATHFLGQVLPGEASLEDEDNARENFTIIQGWTPTFGLGWMGWNQGLDQFPEFVREQWFRHNHALSNWR